VSGKTWTVTATDSGSQAANEARWVRQVGSPSALAGPAGVAASSSTSSTRTIRRRAVLLILMLSRYACPTCCTRVGNPVHPSTAGRGRRSGPAIVPRARRRPCPGTAARCRIIGVPWRWLRSHCKKQLILSSRTWPRASSKPEHVLQATQAFISVTGPVALRLARTPRRLLYRIGRPPDPLAWQPTRRSATSASMIPTPVSRADRSRAARRLFCRDARCVPSVARKPGCRTCGFEQSRASSERARARGMVAARADTIRRGYDQC
jgi:hypothetical protein